MMMKAKTHGPASSLGWAIVFGAIALSAAALRPARAQNVDDQLKKYGCVACHAVDKKVVGPSFKEIAANFVANQARRASSRPRSKMAAPGYGAPSRCHRIRPFQMPT
jgi:cytochrome c551/c552